VRRLCFLLLVGACSGGGGDRIADAGPDGPTPDAPAVDGPAADRRADDRLASDTGSDALARDRMSGALCHDVENNAAPVDSIALAARVTDFRGGAIADGLYELVKVEQYPAPQMPRYRRTLEIADGGSTFFWSVDPDLTGGNLRVTTRMVADGPVLVVTQVCGTYGLQRVPYTVTPDRLMLFVEPADGASQSVFSYQRR
jgi:hypothetical protein